MDYERDDVDWVLVHKARRGELTAGKLGSDLGPVVRVLRDEYRLGINQIAQLLSMSGRRVLDTLDPERVQQRTREGSRS